MTRTWKFVMLAVLAGVIGGFAYDILKGERPFQRWAALVGR